MSDEWTVVCDIIGQNPGMTDTELPHRPKDPVKSASTKVKAQFTKDLAEFEAAINRAYDNIGGFVIALENATGTRHEISRVAFIRRVSKNPEVSFEDALDAELKKAEKAAKKLDEYLAGSGNLS